MCFLSYIGVHFNFDFSMSDRVGDTLAPAEAEPESGVTEAHKERIEKLLSMNSDSREWADDENHQPSVESPDSSLGQAAKLFTGHFGNPRRVIYPGCGSHVIDRIFPESEIVYVDPSEGAIGVLKKGISGRAIAVLGGVQDYFDGKKFDLLFSLNSHAKMTDQLRRLRSNGYVLCNNYFGTQDAEKVIKSGLCDLVAVMDVTVPDRDNAGAEHHVTKIKTTDLEPYTEHYVVPNQSKFLPQRRKLAKYYVFKKL